MTTARATIVVPVHGRSALTRQCLDSVLRKATGTELVVAEDASTDDTAAVLASYGDRIRVVRHDRNRGFAATCNLGASVATTDRLVFLNNDTIARDGWLDALLDHLDEHPLAGIVGAKLLFPEGTVQHAGVVIGQDGWAHHPHAGLPADHPAVTRSRRLQAVTGAAMLVRRDVFDALDGFDEGYLNAFEDIDLCLRAGQLGYEVHYCAASCLVHLESASRGRTNDAAASERLFSQRWHEVVRRDDIDVLLADGLVRATYVPGRRLVLEVDPLVGHTAAADPLAAEVAVSEVTARWLRLLEERERTTTRAQAAAPVSRWTRPSDRDVHDIASGAATLARCLRPLDVQLDPRGPRRVNVLLDHPLGAGDHDVEAAVGSLTAALTGAGARVRFVAVGSPSSAAARTWAGPGRGTLPDVAEHADASDRTVPVRARPDDVWVATSWTTMHVAAAASRERPPLRLVRGGEAGGEPTGALAAAARSADDLAHVALFASQLAKDDAETRRAGCFGPGGTGSWASFDEPLAALGEPGPGDLHRAGPRRLLVDLHDSRLVPGELALLAVEGADRAGALPGDWHVSAIGPAPGGQTRIVLGSGRVVDVFGDLTLARYRALLRSHDVAVALHDGPHPGLTALDAAAAGVVTLTSTCPPVKDGQRLAELSSNLLAAPLHLDALVDGIAASVERAADLDARLDGSAVKWPRSDAEAWPSVLVGRVLSLAGW